MNFTTTKTKGWQKHCWEWAKAQQPFELREVGTEHFSFCEILSATYQGKYHFSFKTAVVTFTFSGEDSITQ
jgi:hypothetical protein